MFWSKKNIALLSCTLIAALLLVCGGVSRVSAEFGNPNPTPEQLIFGDANNDGEINSIDYARIKDYMGKTSYTMDVNVDGIVDSKDAECLKNYILGVAPSLPADEIIRNMPETIFEYKYQNEDRLEVMKIDKDGYVKASGSSQADITFRLDKIFVQEKYLDFYKTLTGNVKTSSDIDPALCYYSGYITDGTQKFLLKIDGGVRQDNQSPYARPLLEWLNIIAGQYFVLHFPY